MSMTWREIREEILDMTTEELDEAVIYVEPYDDGVARQVSAIRADEDIHEQWGRDVEGPNPVVVKKGKMILA